MNKCEAVDCQSNHGFVCYHYNIPDQSVKWYCSKQCRALWRYAHGIHDFFGGRQ